MKNKFTLGAFGVAAYVFATMSVQMLNHFVINKEHYAGISFLRAEPIFHFGHPVHARARDNSCLFVPKSTGKWLVLRSGYQIRAGDGMFSWKLHGAR
jgi:hypothetical protein